MDAISALYQKVQAWITKPFTTPLDMVSIFLIVGLLMIAVLFWSRVIAGAREML